MCTSYGHYLQTLPILFFRFWPHHKIIHLVTIWVHCNVCDYASSDTPILSRHMKKRTAGETANRCDLGTPVNHKLAFGSPSGQPLPSDEHHQMTLETDSSQKSSVVAQKCGHGVTREKFRRTGSSSRSRWVGVWRVWGGAGCQVARGALGHPSRSTHCTLIPFFFPCTQCAQYTFTSITGPCLHCHPGIPPFTFVADDTYQCCEVGLTEFDGMNKTPLARPVPNYTRLTLLLATTVATVSRETARLHVV